MFIINHWQIIVILSLILWAALSYRCYIYENQVYRTKTGAVIEGLFFTCLLVAVSLVFIFMLSLVI